MDPTLKAVWFAASALILSMAVVAHKLPLASTLTLIAAALLAFVVPFMVDAMVAA